MFAASACLFLILLIARIDASCQLPKFLTRCKRNDPNLAKCWRSIIEEAPRHLAKGIPECNIPPIDPWRSPPITTETDTFKLEHKYLEHIGTKNFQVINNDISEDITRITLILRFPHLIHACTPIGRGYFLNYTLSGKESCNDADADVTLEFVFKGQKNSKQGKEYIAFNDTTVNVDGIYTNPKFYNMVAGTGGDEDIEYQAQKQPNLLRPFFNGLLKNTIGRDLAEAIQLLYEKNSLDILHPLK